MMTTLPDLIFVVMFAAGGPVVDYCLFWPAHRRRSAIDPAWARKWTWALTIASQWMLVAFGAAALSVPFFAVAHIYQGWNGVLRTAVFGAFIALIVAIFESLWPAMAIHALIDLSAGALAFLVLREEKPA